jgi:hypothetical protein
LIGEAGQVPAFSFLGAAEQAPPCEVISPHGAPRLQRAQTRGFAATKK